MKPGMDVKKVKLPPVLPIVAGLLVLAALWMAWSGWKLYSVSRLEAATIGARQQVADKLRPSSLPSCRPPIR